MPLPQNLIRALDRTRRDLERNAARGRNGVRLVAGLSPARPGRSPKDVVWEHGRTQIWHYRNEAVRIHPPLLIVFSLISRSYVLDLNPGNSFIERLVAAGFDVYLLDWGEPDERDAGNRLEDYVDEYIPAAVDRVRRLSGAEQVNVLGYCLGGVLALLHAAHHPDTPLRSLTVIATPVDFTHLGPMADVVRSGLDVDAVLGPDGNVPPGVVLQGFRVLTPTSQITSYVNLWDRLWSREYVAAHQAMTGWAHDHIPLPGAAARQMAEMLVKDNAMFTDRLTLGGDRVHLSDIRMPFLAVLADRDHIVPEPSAAPVIDLVGSTEKQMLRLDGGHIGLVVGRTAARTTIPTIVHFLKQQSEMPA